MPYVVNETYVFSMQIPEGYTVEEAPKSARVAYNGDQGGPEPSFARVALEWLMEP